MPVMIVALIAALGKSMDFLVGRVLVALGVTFITYQAIDVVVLELLGMVEEYIQDLQGHSGNVYRIVRNTGVLEALQIIAAAISAKGSIQALRNAKQMVFK